MQDHLYLDFECNKQKRLYIAGYALDGRFQQVVLHEGLGPLAAAKGLQMVSSEEFISNLVQHLSKGKRELVAYSQHDMEVIIEHCTRLGISFGASVQYLNLAKAAKIWISRHKQTIFDKLPPLVPGADEYHQRRMKYSLASVMRLTSLKAPNTYASLHTMSRLNTVIEGLRVQKGDYGRLTAVQKAKATNALNHNKFDVEALPVLYAAISKDDEGCFRRARKEFKI